MIPRLARKTLQLPLSQGGLTLLNLQLYYWATVLVTVHWWFSQSTQNPATTLQAALLGPYAALANLVFCGPKAHLRVTGLMSTTLRVLVKARGIYRTEGTFSPHTYGVTPN